jgi:hypothetical protein
MIYAGFGTRIFLEHGACGLVVVEGDFMGDPADIPHARRANDLERRIETPKRTRCLALPALTANAFALTAHVQPIETTGSPMISNNGSIPNPGRSLEVM